MRGDCCFRFDKHRREVVVVPLRYALPAALEPLQKYYPHLTPRVRLVYWLFPMLSMPGVDMFSRRFQCRRQCEAAKIYPLQECDFNNVI